MRVARAILGNARHPVLVADAGKFERSAPVRIGHVSQLHCVVTDRPPPARFLAACREAGTGVEVAAEPRHRDRGGNGPAETESG